MTKNYGDDDNGLTDNGSSLPHPETMKNFSLSKTVDDHDDDDDDVSPLHSKAATPRQEHDLFLDEEGGGGLDHMKNYDDNDDNDNDDDDGLTSSKKGRGDVLSLTSSNGRYTWRCYLLMFLMFTIFLGMLIPLAMKEEKQTEGKAYTALQQENKDLKAQMITANKEIGMLEEAYYDQAEKNNFGVDTEEDDDYYYNSGMSNDDDSTTVSPSDFGVEADDDTVILIGDDYDYVYEFDGEGTGETHSSEMGGPPSEVPLPTTAPAPTIKTPTATYPPTYYPTGLDLEADDDTVILIGDDYDYQYEFDGEGTGETHSSEMGGPPSEVPLPTTAPAPTIKTPTATYPPTYYPTGLDLEADDDTVILIGDDYDYQYEFDGEGTGETHSSELGLSRGNAGTDDVTNYSWISSKVDGVYVGGNASPSSAP